MVGGAGMMRAVIAGASGYVGGELLRWIDAHPLLELAGASSERHAGAPLGRVHPHLRGATDQRFVALEDLPAGDVLFSALPHGQAAGRIDEWSERYGLWIDASADFRLNDADNHERWYGGGGANQDQRERFVYGLPELNRDALNGARFASGVGCNATAVHLALLPLERAGLLPRTRPIVAEVKVGSSESGASTSDGSHHPVRSRAVRSYAPVGHRHTAEVEQTFGGLRLELSVTAIELVRGALATCHVPLESGVTERDVRKAFARFAAGEPFVDFVGSHLGAYGYPEPKLLAGTNRAQIGFALDVERERLVSLCALDNLGKGAAGSAVQCFNLMAGLEETTGLTFRGLHPV